MSGGFAEVLRLRAREQGDAIAFAFRGDDGDTALTYAELDARADGVAAALLDRGLAGERVLLLHPPGLEYVAAVFGCLRAGAVAVPAFPVDPARPERTLPRLQAIARDARPRLALTTPALADGLRAVLRVPVHAASGPGPRVDVDVFGEDVALLQYTSGSTAAPRGVVLTHENLSRNSEAIRAAFGTSPEGRGVSWLPPYHDMGLVGGVLQPVFTGFPCLLMSPLTFLRRPRSWLEAVSEGRATCSGGPDSAYALCVRRVPAEQRAGLDLSSWDVAFDGAEAVRPETLDAFHAAFAPCGLRREALHPCYGLAEATLIVTGGRRVVRTRRIAGREVVGCGPPVLDTQVVIADPQSGAPVPNGGVGEILVRGPGVAAGYRDEPYLRTGDLGALIDGELFVTGRLKEVLVVAGRNHHPGDVERACEAAVPALRPGCGAAFAFGDEPRIGVVFEVAPERAGDPEAVIGAVRRAAARALDARLDAVALLEPRTLPKTTSGKVQRGRCAALLDPEAPGVVARWVRA